MMVTVILILAAGLIGYRVGHLLGEYRGFGYGFRMGKKREKEKLPD